MPSPSGLSLAMVLILLTMPRTTRVGCADKLPQMLHRDPRPPRATASSSNIALRQVPAESHLEIWTGLLGAWGVFLSSLLLCFLSTGYPDLGSMGNVSSLLHMAQLQLLDSSLATPGYSGLQTG